jgi:hypothetical protein
MKKMCFVLPVCSVLLLFFDYPFFNEFIAAMSIVPVFAEPEELVTLIRDASKQPGKDYVIVDVRDDDYNVIIKTVSRFQMYSHYSRAATFLVPSMFQLEKCTIKQTNLSFSMLKCLRFIFIVLYHK